MPKSSVSLAPDRVRRDELLELAVESFPCGMAVFDRDGRVVLVNLETERLFGYSRAEIVGRPIDRLIPSLGQAAHDLQARAATSPESAPGGAVREVRGLHKRGHEIDVEIVLRPLGTGHGSLVLASIADIAARKLAAKRLDDHARMLERSNEALEHFAYVVSHDLKAPLRGIATVAQWLAEDFGAVVDDDARRGVTLMLERVERMASLIDGILEYSRAGKARGERIEVDSGALVEDVVASLSVPPGVTISVARGLPRVVYDATQLRQVFQNLIGNSIEHMGRERGSVAISCDRETDRFTFSVKDDGVGIPPAQRSRVFKPFDRPRSDRARARMGLPIAKRIVERNGGEIWIEPADEGCELRFTVPAAAPGAGAERGLGA